MWYNVAKEGDILKKISDKAYKTMVKIFKVLIALILVLVVAIFFVDKRIDKLKEQQANASLPVINERINNFIKANKDIHGIRTHFKYGGSNYIEVYVKDTWFGSTVIEQKRFAAGVRDNVKAILYEEGYIDADDRLGIYVYTTDGILLAEDNTFGEIKLKD